MNYDDIITLQTLFIQSYGFAALLERKYYACIWLSTFQVSSDIPIVSKKSGNRLE
jgi:hypothetical protein